EDGDCFFVCFSFQCARGSDHSVLSIRARGHAGDHINCGSLYAEFCFSRKFRRTLFTVVETRCGGPCRICGNDLFEITGNYLVPFFSFIFLPLRIGNYSACDPTKDLVVLILNPIRVDMTETANDRMRKVKSILVTQEAPQDGNSPYLKLAEKFN